MLRRSLAVSATAVLAVGLLPAAQAAPPDPVSAKQRDRLQAVSASQVASAEKGTVLSLGEKAGRQLYIVQLEDAAVPSYTGGVEGLAAVKADSREFAPEGAREEAYRDHLVDEQADLRAGIADVTGSVAKVRFAYTDALNGLAVTLTRQQAREVAELDGVSAVQVDEERQLQTDRGPEWIGAPAIWDGSATPSGEGNRGEGIVAGILDSGINAANPSFAETVPEEDGGDGYVVANPREQYYGACDPESDDYVEDFGCNDKLIGAWDFAPGDDDEVGYGYDEDGHGTHTASTTAGNQVSATTYSAEADPAERFEATRTIKGVAPHANVIAYDVCAGGCPLTAIVAGIDQAIEDQVDVINYSIGSDAPSDPWTDPDGLGFLAARDAGIHVATSAGNDGPGAATVGSPADVPWITSVGASTHDRQWRATVEDITVEGEPADPSSIQGLAFANATDGSFPVVDASAAPYNNRLCGIDGGTADDGTFPAGTNLTGLIVLCERGGGGRVEKGSNVASLGAEGMILMNDEASGDSLNADPHALPAVHITYDDGLVLRGLLADGEVTASLSGGQEYIGEDVGDVMAAFSSRGPNRAVDLISPSVSAPGVDILAGNGVGNEVSWGFISGTSMASPHVAGSLALIGAEHPDWTPAEAQSALMTTSLTDVTDNDGTPADWFDMGSGRVDLTRAADAGLVMDVTTEDYLAADPAAGGDVKALNTASMANSQCLETCSWTRTVTATDNGAGAWTADGSAVTDGIEVTVEPATFELAAGESQELTVTADVTGSATDSHQFGNIVLESAGDAPAAHLPVAAQNTTGVFTEESLDIDTRRDAGSQESAPIEAIEITDLDVEANGLVPADVQELSVEEDSTNTDPYDGNGVQVVVLDTPEDATRLVANLTNSTAPDFDMFVGTGDSPSLETEIASSASDGPNESVDIPLSGEADQHWILVQNWTASEEGGTDTVDLETVVVEGDAGNLRAEGPATNPQGEPFTIRAFWDEPAMDAGETWYGSLTLSSAPGGSEIGTLPVTVNRLEDDVTKTVDETAASPGDTLTYTVEVQPNVNPEDFTYSFRDELPEGTTYVEGSGPEGASLQNGFLTWEATAPTTVGLEGGYDITTSTQDDSCVNPLSGEAEYSDLQDGTNPIARQPAVTGDGRAFTAYSTDEFGWFGSTSEGLSFTDDGLRVFDVEGWRESADPGTPQTLPDPQAPNDLAAALWQDMVFTYSGTTTTDPNGAGVSIAGTPSGLRVVELDKMRLADDPTGAQGTVDFQIVSRVGSNDLVVAYDNVGIALDSVTVGAEDAEGDRGQALVNAGDASGVIEDDTVVCMTYADAEMEPLEFTYEVTVDDDTADGTVLRNRLDHSVDNPGAAIVRAESPETTVDVIPDPAVTVTKTRDARQPGTDAIVTFTRPRSAVGERLTVDDAVGGGAVPRRDYRRLPGVITFPAQARRVEQVVQVVNRRGRQPTRILRIALRGGEGYTVGRPSVARVRILDERRRR